MEVDDAGDTAWRSEEQNVAKKENDVPSTPATPQESVAPTTVLKWRPVELGKDEALLPRPRHGHGAAAAGDAHMVMFGGGCKGVYDDLMVYDVAKNTWMRINTSGDLPPASAAFGCDSFGGSFFVHGGMVEYGKYSAELYEISTQTWEWRRLQSRGAPPENQVPCARLGHSFNIAEDGQAYVFGGITRVAQPGIARGYEDVFLNDLHVVTLRDTRGSANVAHWRKPVIQGVAPSPRESHSAALVDSPTTGRRQLLIFGGMDGRRLGDLHVLDTTTWSWSQPQLYGIPPSPRSLHTANVVDHRMIVFGGWTPLSSDSVEEQKEWKCTNSLHSLNLKTWTWDTISPDIYADNCPRARAGHSAVKLGSRIYIWSGRDGFRNVCKTQMCCTDMWYVETALPAAPAKVNLIRASVASLELSWTPVPTADGYVLQISTKFPPGNAHQQASAAVPSAPGQQHQQQMVVQRGPGGQQVMKMIRAPATAAAAGANSPIRVAKAQQNRLVQQLSPTKSQQIATASPAASLASNQQQPPAQVSTQGTTYTSSTRNDEPPCQLPPNLLDDAASESDGQPPAASAESQKQEDAPADPTTSGGDGDRNVKGQEAEQLDEKMDESALSGKQQEKDRKREEQEDEEDEWHEVGEFAETRAFVQNYKILDRQVDSNSQLAASFEAPTNLRQVTLAEGTAYRFRVAAVNALGRGPFSETVLFKTCVPGFPGAPSSIRIRKDPDSSASLSWQPPALSATPVTEYSVYLCVNAPPPEGTAAAGGQQQPTPTTAYMRVYIGAEPSCNVPLDQLANAHIDATTTKPAVIFRIAAKNDKGYGPATQVRWLQDGRAPPPPQGTPVLTGVAALAPGAAHHPQQHSHHLLHHHPQQQQQHPQQQQQHQQQQQQHYQQPSFGRLPIKRARVALNVGAVQGGAGIQGEVPATTPHLIGEPIQRLTPHLQQRPQLQKPQRQQFHHLEAHQAPPPPHPHQHPHQQQHQHQQHQPSPPQL